MKKGSILTKDLVHIIGIPVIMLLIPLVFNFPWGPEDYIVTAILLVTLISAIKGINAKAGKYKWMFIALIIFAAVWFYAELAVGIFTNWGS